MPDKTFSGQHVLVTGGGTGIGRETALAFAELGADSVIITGRRKEPLVEVAALHPAVRPVVADAATEAGVDTLLDEVRSGAGRLDVVVHNAAIFRLTPVDTLDAGVARELLEINVFGPVLLTARLLPVLRAPGGTIVVVSSVAGHVPAPGISVYAATKAAVDSLTRTWAKELAPKGIRVNAVAPGSVDTPILLAAGIEPEAVASMRAESAAGMPLGRNGEVGDIAPWITKLAEPASSWVTGQVITIDGGSDLG
ncbi:MAG: SDR family oxidoreductase [Kutzneria sp.]|nr:SDR family oxidoreductase [Kutzneria sp.]